MYSPHFSSGSFSLRGSVESLASPLMQTLRRESPGGKPVPTAAVVFNLCTMTMGIGILSLGAAFKYTGILLGPVFMLLSAACGYSIVMLTMKPLVLARIPSDESMIPTLEQTVEHALGKPGKLWLQVILLTLVAGYLVTCEVGVKSLLWAGIKAILPDSAVDTLKDHYITDNTVMTVAVLGISFPLSFLRSLSSFGFSSFLSVGCVCYFIVVSFVYLASHPRTSDRDPCHEMISDGHSREEALPAGGVSLWPSGALDLLLGFQIILLSFVCHVVIPPTLRELSMSYKNIGVANHLKVAYKQLERASLYSVIIVIFLDMSAAVVGYVTWEGVVDKPSTILACYPPSNKSVIPIYFGEALVALSLYPMAVFMVRETIAKMLWPEEEGPLSRKRFVPLTVAIVFPAVGLGLLVTTLTQVLGVMAAFGVPSLLFLIPGYTYLSVCRSEEAAHEVVKVDTEERSVLLNADLTLSVQTELFEFVREQRAAFRGQARVAHFIIASGYVMQVVCVVGAAATFI
ncbi:Vacuolar amino acid transporter 2 [Diplonema papillatum]|nr:Vacuolar amino acid transporter 2 [Diplonema papillatum]KAJ9463604.1 Vacuolar amino acid transporter 2 [Diplonema papillatum]